MNVRETVSIVSPFGEKEDCAKFIIDGIEDPFVLNDIADANREYVFSGYVKSDVGGLFVVNGQAIECDSDWKEFEIKFISADKNIQIYFEKETVYYFYHSQLEPGTKKTTWRPSDLDIEKEISDVRTIAIQNKEGFKWLVASGTSASDFTLTNRTAELVAQNINLYGLVKFSGLNSEIQTKINSGIEKVDVLYAASLSPEEAPESGWSTTAPSWKDGQYMWQKTVTTYINGQTSETAPTVLTGATGRPGVNGKDGTSVTILGSYSSEDELNATHPTGNLGDGYIVSGDLYVWNGSKWENVGRIQGEKGDVGVGISKIIEQYYLSSSNTSQSDGNWSEASPSWVSGKYIWTRSRLEYDDGSVSYTTPVLANALNSANSTAKTADENATYSLNAVKAWGYGADVTYIDGGKIYTGSINADQIHANAITTEKLDLNSVTAEKIASRTITADKIALGSLTANEIDVNNLFAQKVTATNLTISGNSILSDITARNITITGNSKFAGALEGATGSFSGAVTATSLTAYDSVYIKQAGTANVNIALNAPATTGVSSLEIGGGFGQLVLMNYAIANGGFYVSGGASLYALTVAGSASVSGDLNIGNGNYSNNKITASTQKFVIATSANANGFAIGENIRAEVNNTMNCGTSTYKWKQVWAVTGTIQTSDRKEKKDFRMFDSNENYEKFFMDLKPQVFRYISGESNRDHFGFIAQDIEESLYKFGFNDLSFAGFCKDERVKEILLENGKTQEVSVLDEHGHKTYDYALRYSEFIPINTYMIQKLYMTINELKAEIAELKSKQYIS